MSYVLTLTSVPNFSLLSTAQASWCQADPSVKSLLFDSVFLTIQWPCCHSRLLPRSRCQEAFPSCPPNVCGTLILWKCVPLELILPSQFWSHPLKLQKENTRVSLWHCKKQILVLKAKQEWVVLICHQYVGISNMSTRWSSKSSTWQSPTSEMKKKTLWERGRRGQEAFPSRVWSLGNSKDCQVGQKTESLLPSEHGG